MRGVAVEVLAPNELGTVGPAGAVVGRIGMSCAELGNVDGPATAGVEKKEGCLAAEVDGPGFAVAGKVLVPGTVEEEGAERLISFCAGAGIGGGAGKVAAGSGSVALPNEN